MLLLFATLVKKGVSDTQTISMVKYEIFILQFKS